MNCPECGKNLTCMHLDMAGWSTYLCGLGGCRNQFKLSKGIWYRKGWYGSNGAKTWIEIEPLEKGG